MDVYSLEDDGDNNIFITQEPSDVNKSNGFGILGNPMDFSSPCASLISCRQEQYSDVSDDDFCPFPSSQAVNKRDTGRPM